MKRLELLVGIAIVLLFVGAVLPAVYTHIFSNPATPVGTSEDEGSHSLSLEESTTIDGVTVFVKDVVSADTAVLTLSYQDSNYKNITADEGDEPVMEIYKIYPLLFMVMVLVAIFIYIKEVM